MPRPLYANDIIYGGLGDDAIHGGAGDDAMSGAEAPAVGYTEQRTTSTAACWTAAPPQRLRASVQPGQLLGYSPTLTYQAQYDPNDPFRRSR